MAGTLSQHLIVDFQGTVSDAENAFHIKINNYSSPGGKDFYAPSNDPSVPLSLSEIIQSITGLDNALHYTHPPTKSVPQKESHAVTNSVTCPTQQAQPPYLPDQITSGYNIDNRSYIQGDGQTIALVEFDDYNSSDISVFTHCYGGSSVPLQKILVDNGSGSAPGQGAFEVEMDMELLMTAAPHLAGLDIYEAPNTEQGSNDMWARIINNDVVNVISTSWGMCEQLTPTSDLDEENALFTIAAAQGQTIVAASGDSGPNDCTTGDSTTNAELAVDDPASQPYVLGVGGTSLSLASDPARVYNGEEVWSNQTLGEASGGGISNYWPMPNWQQGPGVINSYSSGTPCGVTSGYCREVPDVALDADANTGYLIYCTVAAACSGSSWWSGGGTSAGAPLWAAFIALANEKTLHDGGWDLGFVNPYLYQIAQNADGMSYSLDFHDITVGFSNGRSGTDIYPATTGYDLATGLGSFNALYLANSLDALSLAQNGKRGAPGNSLWYFAEGAVGGGFEEFLTIENPTNFLANVQVQYLFTGQPARSFMHGVSPNSRLTVSANTDLKVSPGASHLQSISVIVSEISNIPIVVERPMYFNFRGVNSGSDVIGTSNVTHTNFYFAQGDASLTSNDTTREYITVLNPQTTAATITATFYSGGKLVDTQTLTLPPLQRGTMVTSYHHQAAIQVTSTVGVVVERPMYVTANIAAAGGTTTGAASIIGATNLASEWLFAEGNTGSKFQEYLVISNFTTSAVQASVKLEYTNGTSQSVPVTVNAQSQLYFDVNNANKNPQAGCGCTPTNDVAADITGDSASLVVERVTYFHYNGESGLTDVLGQPGPASKSVYGFAEGTTVGQFQEFLALSNPTAKAVQVAVTMLVNGSVMEQEVTVPAYTCEEININTIVKPMIAAYAPHNADVSIVVQSFGGPVVAERVMYFSFHTQTGGTDIIGYTGD